MQGHVGMLEDCGIQMMEDKILEKKKKEKKVFGLCGLNNNFGLFLELKCS